MSADILIRAPVGLLPVLSFLIVLLYMDSYKLVSLKTVLMAIILGGLTAFAAMYINGWLLGATDRRRPGGWVASY